LNKNEIGEAVKRFNAMDRDKKGFVTVNDIRKSLKVRFYLVPPGLEKVTIIFSTI